MRIFARTVLTLLLIAFSGAGGFLAATKYRPHFDALASQIMISGVTATSADRRIIYYRNPMGEPDISLVPKKDSMDMDYVPVYADEFTSIK